MRFPVPDFSSSINLSWTNILTLSIFLKFYNRNREVIEVIFIFLWRNIELRSHQWVSQTIASKIKFESLGWLETNPKIYWGYILSLVRFFCVNPRSQNHITRPSKYILCAIRCKVPDLHQIVAFRNPNDFHKGTVQRDLRG
jgi:hypothetical protein